jgi:hypothetical protein
MHLYLYSPIYYTAVYHKMAETDTPRRQSVCAFALTRPERLRPVSMLSQREPDAEGSCMTFDDLLTQILALLQRDGRVSG